MKQARRILALWLAVAMLLSLVGGAEELAAGQSSAPAQAEEVIAEQSSAPTRVEEEAPADGAEDSAQAEESAPEAEAFPGAAEAGFLMDGDALVVYEGKAEDVVVPDGVRVIGAVAFAELENLRSVELPASVERIEGSAFANCGKLERVVLGAGLVEIGDCAFENCANLREIALPEGLKRVGAGAFAGCAALPKLELPAGVERVGDAAFPEEAAEDLPEQAAGAEVGIERPAVQLGAEAGEAAALEPLTIGVKEKVALDVRGLSAAEGWTFTSSRNKVAKVDPATGEITGKKPGTAVITASLEGVAAATCKVTVRKAPGKLTLSATKGTLGAGQEKQLTAKLPKGTASHQIRWTSSDDAVATVGESGLVKAVAPGSATITACTYNDKRARYKLTVKAAPEEIELKGSLALSEKQSYKLKATLLPEKSVGKLKIVSSDEGVVRVNKGEAQANGSVSLTLTAVQAGSAKLTVEAHSGARAECEITVYAKPTELKIANPVKKLGVKDKYQLRAETDSNEALLEHCAWKSLNRKVIKIDKRTGEMTALKTGKATIQVTLPSGKKTLKKRISITVVKAPKEVWVEPEHAELEAGEELQLKAGITKGRASQIRWESSDPSVAEVSGEGLVTARSGGEAVITATTCNGKTDTCLVTVRGAGAPVITIDGVRAGAAVREVYDSVELGWSCEDAVESYGVEVVGEDGAVLLRMPETAETSTVIDASQMQSGTTYTVTATAVRTIDGERSEAKRSARFHYVDPSADYSYEAVAGGVAITEYRGSAAKVTVPAKLGGMRVTRIATGAFNGANCAGVTQISWPAGVIFEEHSVAGLKKCADEDGFLVFDGVLCEAFGKAAKRTLPEGVLRVNDGAFADNATISTVKLPEGVQTIGARAFADSALKKINLPDSLREIAEDAFTGTKKLSVTANEGSYAYAWAVAHGYIESTTAFRVELGCSCASEAEIGQSVLWIAEASDGTGELEYQYELTRDGEVLARTDYAPQNFYLFEIAEGGDYALKVSCRDAAGAIAVAVSRAIHVSAPAVEILAVNSDAEYAVAGEAITWTVLTNGVAEPLRYNYVLRSAEAGVAAREDSDSNTFRFAPEQKGEYVLEVTCTDVNGSTARADSEAIPVYSREEAYPAAPELIFEEGIAPFARTEAEAAEYAPQRFRLSWARQDGVSDYRISVDRSEGGSWRNLYLDEGSVGTSFDLSAELFADLKASALHRFSISAKGMRTGEAAAYYFVIAPPDESISVNGETSLRWDQNSKFASIREFTVRSALEWEAESDADWITCSREGEILSVSLRENDTGNERSGNVTVSNGANSASIAIEQCIAAEAPSITWPRGFSTNPNHPSDYPVGEFTLSWDEESDSDTRLRIYEIESGGSERLVCSKTVNQYSYLQETSIGEAFKANSTYRIELASICSFGDAKYEVEEDLLKRSYYVRMTSGGHSVTVNGQKSLVYHNASKIPVFITAGNYGTITTDADWLSVSPSSFKRFVGDGDYTTIQVKNNDSGAQREGHVYFNCGSATATVTVIQDDMSPKILFPENLSQDENHPTVIYMDKNELDTNYYYLVYQGRYLYMERYSNGAYEEKKKISTNSQYGRSEAKIKTSDVTAVSHIRFTAKNGDVSTMYYAEFSNAECYYDSFAERYLSQDISAEAQSDSVFFDSVSGWTVRSDASWLVPAARSGSGNGVVKLSFHVDANATGQPRTGRLIIESTQDDSVLWIDINQAAEEYVALYQAVNSGYEEYDPAIHGAKVYKGSQCKTASFKVYAPCDGRIESSADWIHSSKGSYFDPGNGFTLELDANSPDGSVRTGTVTVSCGTKKQTITIRQAPGIRTMALSSPELSTDYQNPSIVKYEDLKLTWPAMQNAAQYKLNFYGGAQTWEVYEKTIKSDGSSQYSCIIPKECLEMDSTEYQHICLRIYDQYDNYEIQHYYIIASRGDKVLLNGSDAPTWENAPDYKASNSYTVRSSENWTATASQSWIHLDTKSGASGSAFTVTLDENLSASPRSGQVTVTSGGGSAVLRIEQCAYLAEQYPSLISPQYSTDKGNPTIISPMDSLTVTWKSEPQAQYYSVALKEKVSDTSEKTLEESGSLEDGEQSYTFTDLELKPGKLYYIGFSRRSRRWHTTRTSYYFTLSDENAWVKVDGAASAEMEADGDEDYNAYDITSSGYWTAQTDDRWILLNGRWMDQAELDERNALPEEYAQYGNASGNRLYISTLANATGKPRTGTVTVRCGGASATIRVYQYQSYSIAALTDPQLSATSASPTKLSYGDVNLRWSSASGGTGRYMIKVEESDKPRTGYSTVVLKKEGIASTSCTIPVGKLSEGKYYRVFLGTEITSGDYSGQSYYFQLSYENELTVTARLVSSSVDLGRAISVYATASGGSGGYVYTYILYSGETELMRSMASKGLDYYTFPTTQPGKYHVVVWVEDSSGETAKFDTGAITVSDVPDYVYIDDATSTSAELPSAGGSLTRTVRSKMNWIWSCDQSWLQIAASGAANSNLTVSASANTTGAARQATVYVTCGTARATLSVTQYQSSSLECVPGALNFTSAPGSDSIGVTSSGTWTASASDSWIQISKTSGASGDRVVVTVPENTGAARSGSVRFSCGDQSRTVAVNQSASSATRITRVYGVAPVQTGEETNINVYAENAVCVRMIVDGVELAEQYPINEFGVAYVRYKFSQSGRRRVEFSACGYDGVWTQPNSALAALLDVTAPNGALDPVRFGALQEKYNKGDSVTVSWNDGGKAENYVAYVYKDDALLKKAVSGEGGMTKNSLALTSAELSRAGHYSICVMATGKGYDQSSSATSFDIQYEAYLQCKQSSLYNDAGMSSYRGGLRFGDKYTVESEQSTALGMQIARIRDAKGTVGYCDATLLGTEYWHPCLKNGVLVHTFDDNNGTNYHHEYDHPHKLFKECSECGATEYIIDENGNERTKVPAGTPESTCCLCGNHQYVQYSFEPSHPHYVIKKCANCSKQFTDRTLPTQKVSGCWQCEGRGVELKITSPVDGGTDYIAPNHGIEVSWTCSVEVPGAMQYRIILYPTDEPLYQTKFYTREKHGSISLKNAGEYSIRVELTNEDKSITYGSSSNVGIHVFGSYEEYYDDLNYDPLDSVVKTFKNDLKLVRNAQKMFTTGAELDNGDFAYFDIDGLTNGKMKAMYSVAVADYAVADEEIPVVKALAIAHKIAELYGKQSIEIPLDSIKNVFKWIGMPNSIIDFICSAQIVEGTDGEPVEGLVRRVRNGTTYIQWNEARYEKIIKVKKKNETWGLKDVEKYLGYVKPITSIITRVNLYTSIGSEKLERIAYDMKESGDTTLRYVGQYLDMMKTWQGAIALSCLMQGVDVAEDTVNELIESGWDIAVKLASSAEWAAFIIGVKIGVKTGQAINKSFLNVDGICSAAFTTKYYVEAADAFYPLVEREMKKFERNPKGNIDGTYVALDLYGKLVSACFENTAEIYAELDKAWVSMFWNFVTSSSGRSKGVDSCNSMATLLKDYFRVDLDFFNSTLAEMKK